MIEAPQILRKNHKFLTASGLIKQICQPLARFNIHLFTYLKKFNAGGQINLSTDPKWISDYYELSLYKTSEYEAGVQNLEVGLNLWPTDSNLIVFKHGRDYFKSDYGFTLCQKQADGCEFFFFSIAAEHYHMLSVCLNNIDLFEQFILYFKEKSETILKACEPHRIFLPDLHAIEIEQQNTPVALLDDIRTHFIQDIKGNSLAKWLNQHEPLTKRETEYLQLLLVKKTTAELAEHMNISKRTAETHLDHIKQKLGCHSKQELLIKLAQFSEQLLTIKK